MIQNPPASADRQRGFTLIEVTVSLIVTVIILLGVLALFDFSNRLSRVQLNVSDMQQSLRVAQTDTVRLIRMAGRGGLPLGTLPAGWAVAVSNNVADKTHIGDASTAEVLPGTDVLTIRGVFTSSIYQINTANPTAFTLSPAGAPTTGTLHILDKTPTAIPQDLTAIKDAIDNHRPEALLLVSPRDAGVWAVVELDPGASDDSTSDIKVGFKVAGNSYSQFSSSGAGVFPPDLTSAAFVGILEEYRFYVRRAYAVANDPNTDLTPKLSRARAYPGTQKAWGDDPANWQVDIADNIFDLQVALGLDTPAKDPAAAACAAGTIASDDVNCGIYESADGENDDWMYNGEKITDPLSFANSDLHYVRLTTLARTDRPDHGYRAPLLVKVEDHVYDATDYFNVDVPDQAPDSSRKYYSREYRRRMLRTMIDMRNLG
ncbi:MAG TPA: prepilin-type N-terminal cleavage/methylation domain-containing protein [Thermoanaerobaculia bacterium]|jgi:prepilin-type N-terminal cleavage/methylation domain-containing protein